MAVVEETEAAMEVEGEESSCSGAGTRGVEEEVVAA